MSVLQNMHGSNPMWGARKNGEVVYTLHQGQTKVLKSSSRFVAAIAGTGGGKSVVGPLWIMNQIQRCLETKTADPILGLVIAPTHQIMSRATATTMVEMFKGTDFEGRYVESRNIYYLPHDLGKIWLLSGDNPEGVEGGQFDFAWLDEAGQLKYQTWVAVQGRLGQKEGRCLITTTPYTKNWLKTEFFDRFLKGDKNYDVISWSSIENPTYSIEEYERAKATFTPARFAMRYDGNFMESEGLVYPDFESCIADSEEDFPDYGRKVGGIDFGFNDPFVALAGRLIIDEEGKETLYIDYERYKTKTVLADHAAALPSDTTWYADPSRPDSIKELILAGHTVKKAINSIQLGIDAVNKRIYSRMLKISPRCKALIAEASQYQYPSSEGTDGTTGEKPIAGLDHAMDTLRYLIVSIDRRKIAI